MVGLGKSCYVVVGAVKNYTTREKKNMSEVKKILYPSIIAICVACPVFAVDIDTNGQINGSNAMCRIGALGTDNTDDGTPVKFKARWEPNEYTCVPGYYLDHLTATCLPCIVNNFCDGGTFIFDDTNDVGLYSCSDFSSGQFPYSDASASSTYLCYRTGAESCSKINKVNPDGVNTVQYATSGDSVSFRAYYPDDVPFATSIDACEITLLTCKTGYAKNPASNGAMSNYIGQIGNISRANTKWRARNGSTTGNNSSSTSIGYGNSTGMTNGTVEYAWVDGAKIHMRTSCNNTRPEAENDTRPNSTFNTSSTGSICWCNMDSYTTNSGTTVSTTDTVWVSALKGESASECADWCSYACFSRFQGSSLNLENLLLGTYGQHMDCEAVQYHCDPGYYLPANSTTCTLCNTSGKFCEGGDFLFRDVDQGIGSCPEAIVDATRVPVYSAPGSYANGQCYITSTKTCSSINPYTGGHGTASYPNVTNSNATVMTYYDGNSGSYGDITALNPVNACAMTLSCDTGYTSTTAGVLSNYVFQNMFWVGNKNISYLEVDGLTNSVTQIDGGAITGLQNGEYRLTWSDNTSVHGFASCTANETDRIKYDCNCSLDSYSLLGGTTVSVSPAKMYKENTYEDSDTCRSKCAFKCAVEGIARNQDFRSNLFGDLGAQPVCEASGITCNPGTYLPANASVCQPCTSGHWCGGGTFTVGNTIQGLGDCPNGYANSDIGARSDKQCYRTGSVACATFNPRAGVTNYAKETGVTYASLTNATYREYNGSSAGQILDNIGACAVTALNCVTGYAMNTPGVLSNYTLQSMLWIYNTNIKYLALDSSTAGSSSGNDQGATTGMTPGDWEVKWSDNTKVNGNASCALNSYNTYDCNCNLTSYTITNGSPVSVSPARTTPVSDTYNTLPICQTKCAAECATQISQTAAFRTTLFGTLGGQPYCDANTINLNWYNQNTLIQAGYCTYDGAVTFPSGPFTRTGWHTNGWQIRQ